MKILQNRSRYLYYAAMSQYIKFIIKFCNYDEQSKYIILLEIKLDLERSISSSLTRGDVSICIYVSISIKYLPSSLDSLNVDSSKIKFNIRLSQTV